MKFTCTQENINRALLAVSHVASKNVTLPILNNILIRAEANEIKLSATNLEIGITTSVRGKVDTTGVYTVPAKLLNDYISVLPEGNISFELTDHGLVVVSERSRTLIKGAPAEDFPVIPAFEAKQSITCSGVLLRQALSQVMFAAATDEMRPEISGVYLVVRESVVTLAATDSYRLAEKKFACTNTTKAEMSVIVPLNTLGELVRVVGETDQEVEISFAESQIQCVYDDVTLISRLVEGNYPDYQQIIPTTIDHQVTLVVTELVNMIKAASLFCKPGINDVTLTLAGDGKQLTVSAANSQSGENTSTVSVQTTGGEIAIVFNYRYLLDGLSALDAESAQIGLTNSTSPGLLQPVGDENYRYIIMPIRQ